MSTLAVLPVKSFAHAKQRLREELQAGARRALAEAMFADVLTALRRTEGVDAILVVSGDVGAQRLAAGHGAAILEDRAERGQSAAAAAGARRGTELGHDRVLLVPGDVPALDPAELGALLARPRRAVAIVPDRHGTGTNGLLLSPPDALAPSFGEDSRARHVGLARGLDHEVVELGSLGLDVDTPDDLEALRARLAATRGGAAHTRGLLIRLARVAVPAA